MSYRQRNNKTSGGKTNIYMIFLYSFSYNQYHAIWGTLLLSFSNVLLNGNYNQSKGTLNPNEKEIQNMKITPTK